MITFSGLDDYRLHYKDDLHRYNLKLKLCGKPIVNQEEFCEIEDGISSISGSESEDERSVVSKTGVVGSPKIYFHNHIGQKMAVYRSLLHSKKVKMQFKDVQSLFFINFHLARAPQMRRIF